MTKDVAAKTFPGGGSTAVCPCPPRWGPKSLGRPPLRASEGPDDAKAGLVNQFFEHDVGGRPGPGAGRPSSDVVQVG